MKTKREYDKEYYQLNKQRKKDAAKKYALENPEKIKEYLKGYQEINAEKIKSKNKEYRDNNKEKIKKYFINNKDELSIKKKEYRSIPSVQEKNREYSSFYITNRRKVDPLYKLKGNMRSSILQNFKRNGYKKNTKTQLILCCSFKDFKDYIESKFESWMTWDNYGAYDKQRKTWQLDHIIPISSAKTEEDVIRLNHYTNFQPLESLINILKSNKL